MPLSCRLGASRTTTGRVLCPLSRGENGRKCRKDGPGEMPRGILAFEFVNVSTGEHVAVFDLAWPNGLQENLSQPVAVLLNETAETLATASANGCRCFAHCEDFKRYVEAEILSVDVSA
jgi:hypothetical protein